MRLERGRFWTQDWDVPCRAVPRGLKRKEGFLFRRHAPTYLPISYRSAQHTLSTIYYGIRFALSEMEGASGVLRLRLYACVRAFSLIPVIERGVGGCVCLFFYAVFVRCCYDDDEV